MFTAIKVEILRPSGEIKEYELSLGGGEITEADEDLYLLLKSYAAETLHNIKGVTKVQTFLAHSGYGLTNVILREVSALYEVGK